MNTNVVFGSRIIISYRIKFPQSAQFGHITITEERILNYFSYYNALRLFHV